MLTLPKRSLVYSFSLVVAGAALFSVLALYFAFSKLLDQQYRATDVEKAVSIGYVIDAYVSNEIRRLRLLGTTLASNDDIALAVRAATRTPAGAYQLEPAAEQVIKAWIPNLEVAALVLANRDGATVFQHGGLSAAPVTATATNGEQTMIARVGHGQAIAHTLPLSVAGARVGTLTLAIKLDDRFASRIANDTFTAITLVSADGQISTSLAAAVDPAKLAPHVRQARATKLPVQIHDEKSNSSQVFVATQIVDQPYVAVIGVQSDTALATLASARMLAIAIASAVLLLALLIGGAYVYRVTRPLRRLQRRAEEVVAQQSDESPPEARGDEVEQLVQRFDWMTGKLLARTAELDRARTVSERANEAKSLFVANVSHEIRTPMNGVLGMLQVLQATPLNTEQRHHTSTAQRAAESLLAVINELLDFSKAEANRISLEKRPFCLPDLLADIDALFRPRMDEQGLRFQVHAAADVPIALIGDPLRLRQIIVNLIGNAHKFTATGSIAVQVTGLPRTADPSVAHLEIEVRDSGIGIAPEAQASIFEAFSQAEGGTTARKFGGSGLGLAICRHLARLMDGDLTVASTPGLGSTFSARLEVERDFGTNPELHISTGISACRVIVVTQDAALARRFAVGLSAWTPACEHAQSLEEARRRARVNLDTTLLLWDLATIRPVRPLDTDSLDPTRGGRLNIAIRVDRSLPEGDHLPEFRFVLDTEPDAGDLYSALVFAASGNAQIQRARELSAVAMPTATAPSPASVEPTARTKPHALLVDDNDINRLVGKAMLAQLGVAVDTADDGIMATEAVKLTAYDIVFMDIHMPHLDGIGATQAIRELEARGSIPVGGRRLQRLPIIALSASVYQEDVAKCMASGMDAFLGKPMKAPELRAVVDKWVHDKVS